MRDRLVRRLLALGPRFASGERTGELANTLLGGVDALDAYLAQYLPQVVLAALVPALVLAAVLWSDPLSALVLLLTFPLVPLFMWLIGSAAEARTRRQWVTLSRLAARLQDALAGLATLRAFGRVDDEAHALEQANERHRTLTMEVLRLAFVSALALEALATLGTAVVAVEVGLRLLYARIEFREALFVLVLAPEFYRPLRALGAAFHAGMAGREAAARMAEIVEAEGPLAAPAVLAGGLRGPGAGGVAPPRPGRRASGSSRCGSRTTPGARTLSTTSRWRSRPVETLALVGPTGAGKTTAAHLLLRFLEPDAGRVLVDDMPLAVAHARGVAPARGLGAAAPAALPRHAAREPPARPAGGLRRRHRPCARARPPRGPGAGAAARPRDARRRGRRAPLRRGSPARRPRSGLPRRTRRSLVLDEPTAQLDLATEAAVVEAVERLCRGRTVLLVAHRLTTVAAADRVALVSRGRVIEEGTPEALASLGHRVPRLLAAWRGAP